MAAQLRKLDPEAGWLGGSLDIAKGGSAAEFVKFITRKGAAAVMVGGGSGRHSVIVEGVAADGTIMIRDPLGGRPHVPGLRRRLP